jgi:hypothetical protein
MSENTYNGWRNYETWCVNLWLSNDEGLYNDTRDLVQSLRRGTNEDDRYSLANALKDRIDDLAEYTVPGCREGANFVVDLLGAALSEVDWYEIADVWLHDMAEA